MADEVKKAVYDVLVEECKAYDDYAARMQFALDWPECREYRFQGALGFGGKVWFNPGPTRCIPYVTCYREDETPARLEMIERANARLVELPIPQNWTARVLYQNTGDKQ